MDKKEAIKVLNQLLDQIPELRQLEYGNEKYSLWYYEVCDTLESIFSRDSVEYRRFTVKIRSWDRNASEAEKQERYLTKLDEHETDLRSIIKRLEIKKPPIINRLETLASEISTYQHLQRRRYRGVRLSLEDEKLKGDMRLHALKNVGVLRDLITEVTGKERVTVTKKSGQQYSYDVWFTGLSGRFDARANNALSKCLDLITVTIGRLEDDIDKGVRDEEGNKVGKPYLIQTEPPKAFIAHKGETKSLDKLKDFLDALGVQYLIAEAEPSNGRLVEPQVTWSYEHADFAIILATKGGVIDKTKGVDYMGMNVADELGRAREVFKNRTILLLETGVEPHTNISGIVHERFTPQSMDKAFIKIAKELRNWGFIRAGEAK